MLAIKLWQSYVCPSDDHFIAPAMTQHTLEMHWGGTRQQQARHYICRTPCLLAYAAVCLEPHTSIRSRLASMHTTRCIKHGRHRHSHAPAVPHARPIRGLHLVCLTDQAWSRAALVHAQRERAMIHHHDAPGTPARHACAWDWCTLVLVRMRTPELHACLVRGPVYRARTVQGSPQGAPASRMTAPSHPGA